MARKLANILQCEFLKLRKSKAFLVMLVVLVIGGITTSPIDAVDGYIKGLKDTYIIVFMVSIFAGIFIADDFKNKTMQGSIFCGTSRMLLLSSKVIVFFFATALFSIMYPLAIFITSSIFSKSPEIISLETIKTLFCLTIVGVLSNCTEASISALIAFCFKDNSVATISVSIVVILFGGNLIAALARPFPPLAGFIAYFLPFNLSQTVLSADVITGDLIRVGIVAIGYIIIFFTIAYGIFRKAELK